MPGLTLHELGKEADVLDIFLAETEGEATPEIADLMSQLAGGRAQKVDAWCSWINDRSVEAAAIREEEVRLAARRKALENAVIRSKAQLQRELECQGFADGLRGIKFSAGIQNNPAKVVGDLDPATLDEWRFVDGYRDLVRIKPETLELDRKAVLKAAEVQAFIIHELELRGVRIVVERGLRIR